MKPLRRRNLQIRLRTLMIGITLFGTWLGWEVNHARRQAEAVAEVQRLGGRVLHGYQSSEQFFPGPTSQREPGWYCRLVGPNYAGDVVVIDLSGTSATDVDIQSFESLTELESLNLAGTLVTDKGLRRVAGFRKLTILDLSGTAITDRGLSHLQPLHDLEWLNLEDTRITDAGMPALQAFPKLSWLSVENTQVSDAGIEPLRSLLHLKSFYVRGSRITPPPDPPGLGQHLDSYPLHGPR